MVGLSFNSSSPRGMRINDAKEPLSLRLRLGPRLARFNERECSLSRVGIDIKCKRRLPRAPPGPSSETE